MRIASGCLVALNLAAYTEICGGRIEDIEDLRGSAPVLSSLVMGLIDDETPVTGIALRKWTREAVVPGPRGPSLRVMTFVEVAWPVGCCICPIEILSPIKGE